MVNSEARDHEYRKVVCHYGREIFSAHNLQRAISNHLGRSHRFQVSIARASVASLSGRLEFDYTILEESGHRVFTYENTYFDTPAGIYTCSTKMAN